MTLRETHRFSKVLEGIKIDLQCALKGTLDRLVLSYDANPADPLVSRIERDKEAGIARLLIAKLHRVDDALRAISQESFGYCAVCQGPIPLKRLQEAPWLCCCLDCQEAAGWTDESEELLEVCHAGPRRVRQ